MTMDNTGQKSMKVHFIGAGPGAADLITVRGLRLIQSSPVCLYAGSLVPFEVVNEAPEDARIINTADMTLEAIIAEMKAACDEGLDVARVHSGDLSLYSAMAEQMRRLDDLGITYDVTPGVPAFAAAAAVLQQELTLPGINQSVVLTRTSRNSSPMPEHETLQNLAAARSTLVIHLSAKNMDVIEDELIPLYGAECPVVAVARASWPDEAIIRGTLSTITDKIRNVGISRTMLVFVGPALSPDDFSDSVLYSHMPR